MSKKNKRKLQKYNGKIVQKSHHEAKQILLIKYGTRCWLCDKDVGNAIQYHHIIPKYAGGHPSDVSNGSLICPNCHVHWHKFDYGTPMYSHYEELIRQFLEQSSK